VAPVEAQLRTTFPNLALAYAIVDHSIEGWLLHDREAVRHELGHNPRLPQYGNPENNCRPAELMAQIFRRNNREYNKATHPLRLAEAADPTTIAKSSPTFRAFQEALLEDQISGKNTPPLSRQ